MIQGYRTEAGKGLRIKRVEALKKIVPEGMTLPEMAFRFILSNAVVSTTIPGMRKRRHVFWMPSAACGRMSVDPSSARG